MSLAQTSSPVPQIANPLVPTAVAPGSGAFTLTVNGTGFVSGSAVYWNGSPRTTTYVSAAQLTAAITAADVATATSGTVTVHQPSGIVSAPAYCLVTNPVTSMGFGSLQVNPVVVTDGGDTLAGDFNGDSNPDVLLDQGNGTLLVDLGNGDGSIQPPIQYTVNGSPHVGGGGTAIGDFNNDSFPDLAFPTYDPNGMQVMLDSSAGALSSGPLLNLSSDSYLQESNAVADLNGDGRLDLVFTANEAVGIALGNGDGTFQSPTYIPTTAYNSYSVAVGDFNRDGIPDIAATVNLDGDNNTVAIFIGHGDGTFAPPVSYSTTLISKLTVADLNGDGFPDLVGLDESNSAVVDVMLNAGNGTFLPAVSYSGPPSYVGLGALAVGDMNGDGKIDVVAQNEEECTNNCIEIFSGNGDGTLQTGVFYGIRQNTAGIDSGEISLADFNHDGKLDITTPWSDGSYVMIQTAGAAPTLVPGMLSFGSQAVGSESQPLGTDLYVPGSTPITINNVTVTGDFVLYENGCGEFQYYGFCTISAAFQPTTTGLRTGTLIVTSSGGTQNLYLSGTGTAALNLSVTPSSINFGTAGLESTSYTQYVYITNIGSQTINLTGVTLSGANPGDFIVSNPCGSSLNVGANCTVKINFKPTAAGLRSATLSVSDNATNSPQTVALSGTGNALHISEYVLNFGDVTVGTPSSQELTLRNLGTKTISVGQFKFIENSGSYSQTNTCASGILPKSNCTITVTFTPQSQGLLDAVLSFSTNGTGTQAVSAINLKGRGE
jgi:hypothetical protein